MEQFTEADNKVKNLSKANKIKEKEFHNLETKLANCCDTISQLKSCRTGLENEVKRLNKKLRKCQPKANLVSVSSQTFSNIDTPYLVTEELPPIFGSHLCIQTKPVYISNSLPDLTIRIFIEETEEDFLLAAAEAALSDQYDREVACFYEEARSRAAALRAVYEEGAIGMLYEDSGI